MEVLEAKDELILSDDEQTRIINSLAKTNRHDYNILKLCEELAELQEVMLKYHLKILENKPPMSAIVDEIGDVMIRIGVFAIQNELEEQVEDRINLKLTKLNGYMKQGKYKGGI